MEKKRWYAIYTRPRWEKKVHRLLSEKGIEAYCPLNKVRRQWSDRVKTVEEPLFKSYVFVRVPEEEKTAVRMVNGVVNFIYWLGKPAVVKDKEIETIKLFLEDHTEVEAIPISLKPGQEVKIRSGIFMDNTASVLKVEKNYAVVAIKSLGYYLKAKIRKSGIELQ